MGHDELKPLTNGTSNPFAHWGATLIDSLSTMAIMGLDEEFKAALIEVEKVDFKLEDGNNIIVFEAIIRYMGGLLSAYELSGQQHDILLQKAHQLGNTLAPSFNTPTGLFPHQWNPSR
jgi:mannosyl-oligosaccharide alpha-1,2-mannosidase